MKLHSTKSLSSPTSGKMGNNNHQQNNPNRPFGGHGSSIAGRGEDLGPTDVSSGGTNDATADIYSSNSTTYLQPFDKFPSPYCTTGVGMTSSVGIPFTHAQWKELQRQALIYKCIISSVPVPSNLIFPSSALDSSAPSLHNLRYSKNGDPEPGRCKRTDGKKWRCSREVAPNQKYCEHHLRRGRSRSRKLVEAKNNAENHHKKTRLQENPLQSFNAKTDLCISAAPSRNETDRDLVIIDGMEQQRKCSVESNLGFENEGPWIYCSSAARDLNRDYTDLFSHSTFPHVPEIGYQTEPFNVWSIDNFNHSNNNMINAGSSMSQNDGDLSPSLTLSMAIAARNVLDEEMGNIQMGSEIYSDKDKDCWEPFSGGGPLEEVLAIGSVPYSPYDSLSSNPATNVSLPSALAANPLEVTFKWLS